MNSIDRGLYKIKNKVTNQYLKTKYKDIMLEEKDCSNTVWNIIKIDDKYNLFIQLYQNFLYQQRITCYVQQIKIRIIYSILVKMKTSQALYY